MSLDTRIKIQGWVALSGMIGLLVGVVIGMYREPNAPATMILVGALISTCSVAGSYLFRTGNGSANGERNNP